MTIRRAIAIVGGSTAILAFLGASVGWSLGVLLPGYYRSIFRNGNQPWFDPTSVGIGLGISQGIAGGVVIGVAIVLFLLWREMRLRREVEQTSPPPKRWLRNILLSLAMLLISPFALFAFYLATSGGNGSQVEAAKLRTIVKLIGDPESGEGSDSEYESKRFPNGEWALGIGRDSHGILSKYRGGGTLVVKDSQGRVRCYFGHVCGPGAIKNFLNSTTSLAGFYEELVRGDQLVEQQWP